MSASESGVPDGPVESLEIERKYTVGDQVPVPEADAFVRIGLTLGDAVEHRLEAQYFDTPEFALGAQRVAVRVRRGGSDAGWHLKEQGEPGARELLWPPGEEMPAGLYALIQDRLGGAASGVGVIATLRTVRTVRRLRAATGADVVELADDRVDAVNETTGVRQRWREWEAELLPGADPVVLDGIERVLTAAGAERVRGTSKIQRTMGVAQDAAQHVSRDPGDLSVVERKVNP